MRLSRKVGLVIAFIAIAIVLGFMGSTYLDTTGKYSALQERHHTAQSLLPGLIAEKAELENEESRAKAMLDTSKGKFPAVIESIEYGSDLCRTAVEHGLRVIDLATWPPRDREVDGIKYPIAAYRVVVAGGSVSNILDFMHALRTPGDFELPWSADIYEVEIDYERTQATISLEIFAYRR